MSKMQSQLLISLLLVVLTAANPIQPQKTCKDYTLPITTTTLNFIWGLPELETNYDATTFTTNLSTWNAATTFNPISGAAEATADYKISGTFCAPTKGGSETVLLATHGLGFDRRFAHIQTASLEKES